MDFPTTIHESNVLDGIAAPVAILRAPQNRAAPEPDLVIEFDTDPGTPPLAYYEPDPDFTVLKKLRSGEMTYEFQIRTRIVFPLPALTAAEAVKWRTLWNYYLGGYKIIMRPHNDANLQLEWDVCPTPGTAHLLGYIADKYLGHSAELQFTSRFLESSINLRSSAVHFKPVIFSQG